MSYSLLDIQLTELPGFVVHLDTSLHVLKHVTAQWVIPCYA